MPRIMPHDEQSGKSGDAYASERYAPVQPHRQPIVPGRKVRNFYSDEHPELPKVRRASLPPAPEKEEESALRETSAHLPRVTTRMTRAVRQRVEPPPIEEGEDEEWEVEPRTTGMTRVVRLRVEPSRVEDEEWEAETPRATNKILVSRRRPSAIYEPPPSYTRTRRTRSGSSNGALARRLRRSKRPVLSPLVFAQRLTQQPDAVLVGGIVLILTALLFVLAHMPAPGAPHIINIGEQGNANNATATAAVSAANPHQLVIVPPATDHPSPPVLAQAAYLLDADSGATLYAHNPFMHLPVLSTTKMMTALIAAEKGDPNQSITINDSIANDIGQLSADSSLMGIKKGETYTLKELLYGLMLVSGNDAAVVIADQLAGSQLKFVEEMNARAAQISLQDTHFMNPHGLLETGHYSSAHDLAVLGKYSLSNPLLHEIATTRQYTIPANNHHPEHVMENGNQFVWWYPGADVSKQGWDGGSDFVQVVSAVRNNHRLIGVVIHTVNWWTDMRDLMNWGFNTYDWVSPRDVSNSAEIPYSAAWNSFASDKKENTIPTADQGRYYIYTGYSVSSPVLSYFDGNGGLGSLGYPLGQAKALSSTRLSQRFEHTTIQCDKQQNGQWKCKKV